MTLTTVAGSTLAITAARPVVEDAAAYGALAFVPIEHIEQIGTLGATQEVVTLTLLGGALAKYKGSSNNGSLQPVMVLDDTDPGQQLLRNAARDKFGRLFSFCVALPTGARRYFGGKAFGFPETIGAANSMVTASPVIEVVTDIVEVAGAIVPVPPIEIATILNTPGSSTLPGNQVQGFTAMIDTIAALLP